MYGGGVAVAQWLKPHGSQVSMTFFLWNRNNYLNLCIIRCSKAWFILVFVWLKRTCATNNLQHFDATTGWIYQTKQIWTLSYALDSQPHYLPIPERSKSCCCVFKYMVLVLEYFQDNTFTFVMNFLVSSQHTKKMPTYTHTRLEKEFN